MEGLKLRLRTTETELRINVRALERQLVLAISDAAASAWGAKKKTIGKLEAHTRKVKQKRLLRRLEEQARKRDGEKGVKEMHRLLQVKKVLRAQAAERPEELENELEKLKRTGAVKVIMLKEKIQEAREKEKEEQREREEEQRKREVERKRKEEVVARERAKDLYRPPSFHAMKRGTGNTYKPPKPPASTVHGTKSNGCKWPQYETGRRTQTRPAFGRARHTESTGAAGKKGEGEGREHRKREREREGERRSNTTYRLYQRRDSNSSGSGRPPPPPVNNRWR